MAAASASASAGAAGASSATASSSASPFSAKSQAAAAGLCAFVDASPSPFHAAATAAAALREAGFEELRERDVWGGGRVKPGGKYFFLRNGSTVCAFAVGGAASAAPTEPLRFCVVGAHTDSCALRVNPVPTDTAEGYARLAVSTYGGGLWHTWFDRDLGVAGRLVVRRGETEFEEALVHVQRPVARVPTLCIHLTPAEDRAAFKINKETHLKPILETAVAAQLAGDKDSGAGSDADEKKKEGDAPNPLLDLVAREVGAKAEDILAFELALADTQPSAIGGLRDEFVFAPRLDNLCMSYTGVQAIIRACADEDALAKSPDVWGVALFDNEEVGSATAQGAGSPIINELFQRVLVALKDGAMSPEVVPASIRRSILVSADMAHAVHPNYPQVHQAQHKPAMHKGLVLKINANQRYATTAPTSWALQECARRHDIPTQEFVVRADSACGSTIGPIIAENTGLRTVDVGIAQLSMHSIRETCGVEDIETATELFAHFFSEWGAIDDSLAGSTD